MTLCVAWRWENDIQFASDSRITVGSTYSDLGIKICAIPVRIISAIDRDTGEFSERFSGQYGLAFSGSFTSAYVIREILSEVLQNLQFVGLSSSMSIERIMNLVHKFHAYYTDQLRAKHSFGLDLDFILAGKCPVTGTVKVFQFIAEQNATYSEVLLSKPFSFSAIGSGEPKFSELIADDLAHPPCRVNFAIFNRLRDVIRDSIIESVGGAVQAGIFENGQFRLMGVLEHDLTGSQPLALPSVRGLVLSNVFRPEGLDDFHVHYSFKAPFQADLDQLI